MTALLHVPQVPGLSDADAATVRRLAETIVAKARRNQVRRRYYDYKSGLKDLGISIPPHMRKVETAIGWPAKAVDAIARRCILQEFTLGDGVDPRDVGLPQIVEDNRLSSLLPQALTSALIGSVAFAFVTLGDVEAGEPEVLITMRSSEFATGTWNPRTWSLSDALSIVSVDENGVPDHMVLYVPNRAVVMRRDGSRWDVRQSEHELGVPVEPMPYRPMLDRPFGRSRISRPVMSLTDTMVRTLLRTEVGAEFYNAPQRWAMGAHKEAFADTPGWEAILGHMLAIGPDEEGNVPTVGQFPQQSMEPNLAQMRALAQQFAAETSLPLRSLGIVGDNPESEGAINQANDEIEIEISHWQNTSLTPALRRTMATALRVLDDSPAARSTYATLDARWRPVKSISPSAAGDWLVKVGSVIPDLPTTSVGLEMAGLTMEQAARYKVEESRERGRRTLEALVAQVRTDGGDQG